MDRPLRFSEAPTFFAGVQLRTKDTSKDDQLRQVPLRMVFVEETLQQLTRGPLRTWCPPVVVAVASPSLKTDWADICMKNYIKQLDTCRLSSAESALETQRFPANTTTSQSIIVKTENTSASSNAGTVDAFAVVDDFATGNESFFDNRGHGPSRGAFTGASSRASLEQPLLGSLGETDVSVSSKNIRIAGAAGSTTSDSCIMWFDAPASNNSMLALWGEDSSNVQSCIPNSLSDHDKIATPPADGTGRHPGIQQLFAAVASSGVKRARSSHGFLQAPTWGASLPTTRSASTMVFFALPTIAITSSTPSFKKSIPARELAFFTSAMHPRATASVAFAAAAVANENCSWQAIVCAPTGAAVELLHGHVVHEPELVTAANPSLIQPLSQLQQSSADRPAILHTPFALELSWAGSPSQYTMQKFRELRRGSIMTLNLQGPLHFIRCSAAVATAARAVPIQSHARDALLSLPLTALRLPGSPAFISATVLKRHSILQGPGAAGGISAASTSRHRSPQLLLLQAQRLEELTSRDGGLVLFEYSEQQPLFVSAPGMGSRLITYRRNAAAALPNRSLAADAASAGGVVKPPAKLTGITDPGGAYPLLGGINAAGDAGLVTVLDSPLFAAAVFQHAPVHNDFLLVLRLENWPVRRGQELLTRSGGKHLMAYLRELPQILLISQQEPKIEVPLPVVRKGKLSQEVEEQTRNLVSKLYCYKLLCLFRDIDVRRAAAAQAATAKGAVLPDASASGIVPVQCSIRISDAMRLLHFQGSRKAFADAVSNVASWQSSPAVTAGAGSSGAAAARGPGIPPLMRLVDAPSPSEFLQQKQLTPEIVCAYESMRWGEAALTNTGIRVLRIDSKEDGRIEDALQRLQNIYDRMIERLKAASALSSDTDSTLWQHDACFKRLRQTLEAAHAICLRLQTTPWATASNFRRYRDDGDVSALALQDPGGVGDPSGSGYAFSFIHEHTRTHLSGRGRGGVGGPSERKEGTDKDVRALTMVQMAGMLQDLGVSLDKIRKMKRWERVNAIRDRQNAQKALLGRSGSAFAAAGGTADLTFATQVKLTLAERRELKSEQERTIQERQMTVLADKTPVALLANDIADEETDEEFAEALEAEMDAAIMRGMRKQRGDRSNDATAELAEVETFAQTFRQLQKGAGAAAATVSAGPAVGINWRPGGVASSVSAAMPVPGGVAAHLQAEKLYDIPASLLRPPQASLTCGSGDAVVATASQPPMLSHQQRLGETGLQPPPPTNSSKVPSDWQGFAAPPPPPSFVTDAATGAVHASGHILRIIRTTVDSAGRQVVRVTYSTNEFAVAQSWLKHRSGVDLGALGLQQSAFTGAGLVGGAKGLPTLDQTGKGLVATGLYADPRSGNCYTTHFRSKVESEREQTRVAGMLAQLRQGGFVLDGSRWGQADELKVTRVVIHGTPVNVCPNCRLWGHRKFSVLCPATGVRRDVTDLTHGEELGDNSAHPGTVKLPPSAQSALFAASVAAPVSKLAQRKQEASSARRIAILLEALVISCLREISFREFARPVPLAEYGRKVEHPMDLMTLRVNVVARKYSSWEAFADDVRLLCSNCIAFNGATHVLVKSARSLVKRLLDKDVRHRVIRLEQKIDKELSLVRDQIAEQIAKTTGDMPA